MEPQRLWLPPLYHGLITLIFILPILLLPVSFFDTFESHIAVRFGATSFVIPTTTPKSAYLRENLAGKLDVCRELLYTIASNRRFENKRKCLRSNRMGTQENPCSWGRLSALGNARPSTTDMFDARPETEIPMKKVDFPHQPPKRVPFDLDLAALLANFAFETYRSPGRLAWEVEGDSGSEVRFSDGKFVSKVFPGMLTVSLLAVEGLPTIVETLGGDNSGRKTQKRVVNPCIAMVLSDKDMWSGIHTSAKRHPPGGRFWGELFSMHVHDPGSSVLEMWLLDRGVEGVIPLSMRGIFGGLGGHALVGTSRVLLSQVLRSMNQGIEDSWSGWVEMEPVDEARGGVVTDEPVGAVKRSNGNGGRVATRILLDLRFAPIAAYHMDMPTAPRASDEDLEGPARLGRGTAGWQDFLKITDGVSSSETEHSTISSRDDRSSATSVSSTPKEDRGGYDLASQVDRDTVVGRTVVLRDDGMPDWDVLTDRLPRQRNCFELTCFIDNAETDTQVCVWRDSATKQLIVAFRGTEAWKDLLTDANFLLDELDREVRDVIVPPAEDIMEVVRNTTASWKKERVKPLPETLGEQKENLIQTINKVMESSADLLRDLRNTSERKETPEAAVSTPDLTPARAKKMLSAVQEALEHGGVKPVSASEYLEPDSLDGEVERNSGSSRSSSNRGGGGGLLARLREVGQRVVGGDGDGVGGGETTALAPMTSGDGVLADTLAWVQQVAGAQMEAIAAVTASSTGDRSNSTSEILAPFLRDQQDLLEATKDLVAKVNEFRDILGGFRGLDGVEEKGKKVIYEKICDLRATLANATSTEAGGDTPKIHSGFKNAYMSVNRTLSAIIWGATDGKPEDWHVYMTGHSLGGALGTLAALDHARRYPNARLTMYNFGSPRVGNRAFAKLYNSFVGDSFRVVNNMDVVARMPRGTMGRMLLDYRHAGRTVMVDDDPSQPAWVEGESEGGCPLDEDDPVTWVLTRGSKATDFFDYEMKIMEALLSGKGIDHHLEPCYFAALDSFYTEGGGRRAA